MDKIGRDPGWYAAMDGDLKSLSRRLKAGLNVDHADKDGTTLLWIAAHYGQIGVVRMLLDHGAQVDLAERKYSNAPLWEATRESCASPLRKEEHISVVEMLLAAGADPSRANKVDKTAPGWAEGQDPHRLAVQAIYRAHGYEGDFTL